jgi:1,4-alpha-glucan branching enzyme
MKRYLLLTFLFSFLSISAQVTSVPQYPTETDSIKIIFDATKGGQGLKDYTGVVYTHTGVITNLSNGQWKYVKGTWGDNNLQPALTRIGPNLYELKIGYPRIFYGITNINEKILKLAFVFRSANGQQQTEDIFHDIFLPGINVFVNNPQIKVEFGDPMRSPGFASPGDTVKMHVEAVGIGTVVASVKLFIDNNLAAQTNDSQLFFDFIASSYSQGAHNTVVVATDTGGLSDTTSFVMFVNPQIINEPVPFGYKPGINISGNDVHLVLFAPYKKFVYVLGSFNDWMVTEYSYMKKHEISPDSVLWHLSFMDIQPAQEWLFQYLVDGNIRIADPYSEKVLDPWNDQYISGTTYPNLTPYPSGKTNFPVTAIRTGNISYQWQITDFEKPLKTDLVIYELLIRDFLQAHDYKTLKDTLMYLKNLGVNAIELMPVNEFEGNESWGYNPSFYFAPDKYYGPADELKKLIDYAHQLGMAVIIDIVLNHSYGQSPLVRLYWDQAMGRPAANNPWYNVVSPNPVYSWGYDFNHESIHTKNFMDRVNKFWITEYKVDGFRFDFTKGFTNTPGDGGSHDISRINILKRMADVIWSIDSTSYVILEHFAPNSEEKILADYGMMLWGNVNHQYNEATMGYNSNLSGAVYKERGWIYPHLISYMESHDEERLMFKNLQYGNSSGDYNIKDIRVALNRIKLAAAFFFTIPGPKMIWQFGELGYDYSINYGCRVCNKPIRWDYFSDTRRNNLYKVFAALTKLKTGNEAFRSTNFTYDLGGTVKRIRIIHSSMDVIVIGNFGVTANSISPQFTFSGTWYNYFSGDSIAVGDPFAAIALEPGEFHIYTSVKLPSPEPGILTSAEDYEDLNIREYHLEQNYPNPFNPVTIIRYQVPAKSYVTLKVFDIVGREIATLVNHELAKGYYEAEFDASKLSSGIYFYRLESGSFTSSKKMVLMK